MSDEPLSPLDDRDASGVAAAAGCLTGCAISTVFWLFFALAVWCWLR